MHEYKITAGQMRIKDGALTLKTPIDLAADEEEQRAAVEKIDKERSDKAKSNAARQKAFREKRKADGWRQDWISPATMELAKKLGGVEKIPDDRAYWITRAKTAEQEREQLKAELDRLRAKAKPKRTPWWRFW